MKTINSLVDDCEKGRVKQTFMSGNNVYCSLSCYNESCVHLDFSRRVSYFDDITVSNKTYIRCDKYKLETLG